MDAPKMDAYRVLTLKIKTCIVALDEAQSSTRALHKIPRACSVGYIPGTYPGYFGGRTELTEVLGAGTDFIPSLNRSVR